MLKMSTRLLLSILLAALCLKVDAYSWYRDQIPNGYKVPNPCNLSTIWPGVGHQNIYGSGTRNPFGLAFAANKYVWNKILCEKDSDGDGMTNGQELGDPNCTWTEGSNSTLSTILSHPGVCEPLVSLLCSEKNSWLVNCGKLNCAAINEPGVRNYTLRFPVTPVPAKETTYICHQFALPNDSVADIIAFEPIVDNARILHHVLLYACAEQPKDNPTNKTFECGMGTGLYCRSLIGTWTIGGVGQCLNSQLGFRIGPGGFQFAILQLLWTNSENKTNLTDSSGMRIYYTNRLRPNRGQIGMVGQIFLEIPPGQAEMTFTGNCSSLCTKHLPQSIFITSVFLYMHNLGKSGDIRLSRNKEQVQILENVTQYDYNSPRFLEYETPIEVKPGDEIQVKCVYNSTQKSSTTYYGEATSDEMCFGIFAYYPLLEGVGICGQWKTINVCYGENEFEPCAFSPYMKLIVSLPSVCAENNCTSTRCSIAMDEILATGCQNYSDVRTYINAFLPAYGAVYERCAMKMPPTAPSTTQPPGSHSPGQGVFMYFGFIMTLMAYAIQE